MDLRGSSQRQRKRLPVGQPFDGIKELFAAWRNTMAHILEADKHLIGSYQDQWVFLWGNLTRWVQTQVATYKYLTVPCCFVCHSQGEAKLLS